MAQLAPLLDTAEAPIPAGGRAQWIPAPDGARLRVALFPIEGRARGSVVVSPGRAEPIEKYFEVVGELQARGFVVLVHDWRGQGRSARILSDPAKGHARGWRRFLADLDTVLATYADRLPKPWIALGHSMGGGLMVLDLAEGEGRFAGAIASGAMLGLRLSGRPVWLVRRLAVLMTAGGRAGGYVLSPADRRAEAAAHAVGQALTHDMARWARFQAQLAAAPALRLGAITWGWLAFATALGFRIERLRGVERIACPLVLVGAEHDRLCTAAAQIAVARRAPRGRYVEVAGAFHEILMETDPRRAVFWSAFDALADEVAPRG